MEPLVKFIEDHPASAGAPYWGGVYRGSGEYILVISGGKIIGVVPDAFSAPGYRARRDAAVREAEERGYKNVATALADGSGCRFYLRYRADERLLPTRKYYVPSAYGGRHLNIEVTE